MDHLGTPETRTARTDSIKFLTALAAGMLFYFATKSPIAGVVLPCLQAGWNSLRTGLWLLRADPDRVRARTCFTFYLATAFWKAAAAALVSIFVFSVAEETFGVQPDLDKMIATGFLLFGGIVLNTILGLAATWAAARNRIRVWVHPKLRTFLHGDLGSLDTYSPTFVGFNHAVFVLGTAITFPVIALGTGILIALAGTFHPNDDQMIQETIGLVILLVGPLAMIPVYLWLSSRIIANHPRECWPDDFMTEPGPNELLAPDEWDSIDGRQASEQSGPT